MDEIQQSFSGIAAINLSTHLWQIITMMILLACSAFFSGAETAFFNLPRRQVRRYKKSSIPLERLTARVLTDPNRFLTALLFGNMTVNVLFFAISSTLSVQIGQSNGPLAATVTAAVCFFVLLLGGELLPKSLAYSNSRRVCLLASPTCYILLRVLGPLLRWMDFLLIQPIVRLFVHSRKSDGVSVNQLRALLDTSRRRGLISRDENLLMDEILKFSVLKTRHVMQPRVEMPACAINAPAGEVIRRMRQQRIVKMPVYTRSIDTIVGLVHFRDLLLKPGRSIASMVRTVRFVPEQKTVESLVEFFRQTRTDTAIVVDEYGGIAGWVELEDVIEQLLGTTEDMDRQDPIVQIGPLQYRLAADLTLHDWAMAFGIDLGQQRLATLGGFVMALMGKIPKPGDTTVYRNMKLTVETVRRNRILSIILSMDSASDDPPARSGETPR